MQVAKVLLVQLAIALVGCCVLAIAAAPVLTRPGRAPSRLPGQAAAESTVASLGVAARRGYERGHRLAAATTAASARAAAGVARAATAATTSCRIHGIRSAWAFRRHSELAIAAVGTRIRSVRTVAYQARHARGPARTRRENGGLAPPAPGAVPLADTVPAGLGDRPPADTAPAATAPEAAERVVDLRDKRSTVKPVARPSGRPRLN